MRHLQKNRLIGVFRCRVMQLQNKVDDGRDAEQPNCCRRAVIVNVNHTQSNTRCRLKIQTVIRRCNNIFPEMNHYHTLKHYWELLA